MRMLKKISSTWILLRRLLLDQYRRHRKLTDSDKRHYARRPLPVTVVLRMHNTTPLMVRAIDISVGGMGVITPQQLFPGQDVRIAVEMYFRGKMRRAGVSARVANCVKIKASEFKTGLQFVNLGTFESALFSKYVES